MDDSNPLIPFGNHAQIDDPNVSQTGGYEQTGQTLWVRDKTLMEVEAATFLVRDVYDNLKRHHLVKKWPTKMSPPRTPLS